MRIRYLGFACALILGDIPVALSQSQDQGTAGPVAGDQLETIVVTAQRREEDLQKVGITVTALSGSLLREQGIQNTVDIARFVPGLFISANGAGENAQFSIRGVTQNDFADMAEGPVAVYVDESYIPNLQGQNFGLFDIDRVEVLKGPQGTLFGRNATGGLVSYVIKKPTDTPSGQMQVTYGSYNQAKFDGGIGGPITDTLSGRASFFWNSHDSIWRNVYPQGAASFTPIGIPPSPCCQDLGGQEAVAGRLQLEAKPIDGLDIRLLAAYSHQSTSTAPYTSVGTVPEVNGDGAVIGGFFASPTETRTGVGPGGVNYAGFGGAPPSRAPGADWFGFIAPNPQSLKLSSDFARSDMDFSESADIGLHVTYDLDGVKLVSITSFRNFRKLGMLDADAGPVNFLDEGSKGAATDFSEEMRAEGSSDVLDWTAGFYFLNIQSHFDTALLAPKNSIYSGIVGFPATGVDFTDDLKLRTRSASIFGQVEYKFTDQFSFILGGRAIRESQQYGYTSIAYLGSGDYTISTTNPLFPALPAYTDSRIERMWAGKAQIDYRPDETTLIYAGVNRGVKAGNFNAPLPTGGSPLTPAQMSYNPETLTSYEVGYKTSFWQGRARLDASFFDYDYENYQAFSFNGLSGYVLNRPARSYGGEISLSILPLPNLKVDVSGSLFHARVKNIDVAAGVPGREVQPTFAPEQQASIRAQYTFPGALMQGDIVVGGDMYYTGGFFTNIQNFDSQRLPGYLLFDAQVTWHDADDRWSLTLFGTNLADKRYGTVLFDLTTVCGCSEKSFGPPRWLGATLGYKL